MIDMDRELSPDAARLLAYLYGCEKAGIRPRWDQFDPPMTREQVEAAADELKRAGFAEPT